MLLPICYCLILSRITWWENGKWDKKMSLNLGADLDKGVDPGKFFLLLFTFTVGQGILVISVNSSVNEK